MPKDEMPLPCSISLRAINPARNIARHYQIVLTTDLFGQYVVDCRWGRIGTAGRARRVSFQAADDAQSFMRGLIRRRQGARKRIGVAYELEPS